MCSSSKLAGDEGVCLACSSIPHPLEVPVAQLHFVSPLPRPPPPQDLGVPPRRHCHIGQVRTGTAVILDQNL
jgi:hypothetical protein